MRRGGGMVTVRKRGESKAKDGQQGRNAFG